MKKNVLVTQGTKDAPTGARPENGRLTTKWGGGPIEHVLFFRRRQRTPVDFDCLVLFFPLFTHFKQMGTIACRWFLFYFFEMPWPLRWAPSGDGSWAPRINRCRLLIVDTRTCMGGGVTRHGKGTPCVRYIRKRRAHCQRPQMLCPLRVDAPLFWSCFFSNQYRQTRARVVLVQRKKMPFQE